MDNKMRPIIRCILAVLLFLGILAILVVIVVVAVVMTAYNVLVRRTARWLR